MFAPAGCPTSGRESGGGARPWCGRLGTVDTGPVALSVGYVSRKGHTLVDTRLSLPKAWTKEKTRLDNAGVPPADRAERPRHQGALTMLEQNGTVRPHRWMAGDAERGRPYGFRRRLDALGERSLWAVPSNTSRRAVEVAPPAASGRGRPPKRPWPSVEAWSQALEEAAWPRREVREGRQGPRVVDAGKRRVVSRTHRRQQGAQETRVGLRYRARAPAQGVQVASALSNAAPETPLGECARVANAEHRREECLQRSKSEAGWSDDEVRHWTGWQQPHTRSFLATGFLVRETERGKKMAPCEHVTADASGHCPHLVRGVSVWAEGAYAQGVPAALATQ